jgi:hypothetical protein
MGDPALGTVVAALGAAIVVGACVARRRLPGVTLDVLAAGGGMVMGVGALLWQEDVPAWIYALTALIMAPYAVVHVRFLFAGTGPKRTDGRRWDRGDDLGTARP